MFRNIGAACLLVLAGCGEQKESVEEKRNESAAIDRACASEQTYQRLKQLAFDEAARVRGGDARALDRVADGAVLTMENPVVRERDSALNVTTCTGRLTLELPPGSGAAVGGERRLSADIRYAAQTAPDGSGLVYQMEGAEPIIRNLATLGGGGAMAANQRVTIPQPSGPPGGDARVVAEPSPEPIRKRVPAPAPDAASGRQQPPRSDPDRQVLRPAEERPARASARPSFNCRAARTRSERLVCGSGMLARLDRSMSALFYSALADAGPELRSALRRSRDRFLAYRERCRDEACVAQAYRDRMDEIRDMASGE